MKGNARTYGLKQLTNIVHETEQAYESLRNPASGVLWNPQMLRQDLEQVTAALARYEKVNDVVLGRKGPGRRGSVERYLMVDRTHIEQTLHRLEAVNRNNLADLLAARDMVHQTLRLLGTESVQEALAGVIDSLPSLAAELGKEVPEIAINDNKYVIRNQASGLLKNVFMHLFRNSLDHGLESAAIRLVHGKPAAGTITLNVDVTAGYLQLHLADDGRGLALKRIREKARDKGLITAAEEMSDENVARQILRAGFSTAEAVTAVSGRGVGMDAVQDFLKREQGKLDIQFTDNAEGADFRQFKLIVSLPETLAERIDPLNAGAGTPLPIQQVAAQMDAHEARHAIV